VGVGNDAGTSTSPSGNITTASNQMCLGNNSITDAFVKVAWTVTSDLRDKTNLKPIIHGLDFVNQLKPTEFQFREERGSEEIQEGEEGCLSFPELRYSTPRAMRAVAKGFNMYGEPISVEGSEFLARALQHETDHLNGILFIDKLSPADRKLAMKEIRESDWFNEAAEQGRSINIMDSPHSIFGRNT
jgi:hypothetical protein